ncbi:uncharacterized protein LOC109826865, partial [Asparagus officinalis]|uniref:uncharacterized protein LOC109826865 n=1 Tax=Asparagus officinalis TaxID=4686 RepID=UPI00098E55D2
ATEYLCRRRYLKKMNKPAVKTIKSPSGDLIDCVDIYKQPSLDHPLLKNHKVQLKPSFNPSDIHSEESLTKIPQDWHINGKCPKGTIPIRRIQKSHILRASSLEIFGKKYPPKTNISLASAKTSHVHALAFIINNGPHYGSRCDINLWKPRVEPSEFSLAQMWIVSNDDLHNTVEAGLICIIFELQVQKFVNDVRFGQLLLILVLVLHSIPDFLCRRLVGADAYQTIGCYNLLCQGFIQTSNAMALDAKFAPVSTYGGKQFLVTFQILKSTTQMGSGHFSSEGHQRAAYVRNIVTLDEKGAPVRASGMKTIVESPNCYDLRFGNPTEFYYGGPGRNPNCP